MGHVPRPEARRDEHLHRVADQLVPSVAEQLAGLVVDGGDEAELVDDDDRVGRGRERVDALVVRVPRGLDCHRENTIMLYRNRG
jgi:hypothetical protein